MKDVTIGRVVAGGKVHLSHRTTRPVTGCAPSEIVHVLGRTDDAGTCAAIVELGLRPGDLCGRCFPKRGLWGRFRKQLEQPCL